MQLSVCLRHCRHQVSRYPQSAALCSFRYPTIKKLGFDAVGNGKYNQQINLCHKSKTICA